MNDDMRPEVLPGDLITVPGLYEARNGDIVRIVGHDGAWWVCECDGKRDWYHNDGTRRFKSTDSDRWKLVRWIGPLPDDEPTTSEQIAEIEGQAADYTPPEGWRKLQAGEVLEAGDRWIRPDDRQAFDASRVGHSVSERMCYIRRIQPEPEPQPEGSCPQLHPWLRTPPEQQVDRIITPDDVAAEALAGAWDQAQAEQQIAELQAQVNFLKGRELTLGTRLQDEKAVATKRLQQVEELRSEVSHVQGLLGEEKLQNVRLETLVADLRAVNAATEKAVNSAARNNTDLESRLRAVAAEFGVQVETNNRLQTQLEAVKAELVQQAETSRRLQIELDAREQVPQAVSDRFEEGWDAGTARAVETIAEWTEPIRTCGSLALAWAVFQNLPHIMRSLTGLTDED